MGYVIGVDLGTSATKTILMDGGGQILASASRSYAMSQPQNGWAEQNPLDWKQAMVETIQDVAKTVDPSEILAIGLSGQMHGLVMLDEANQPLGQTILWCDQRSSNEVADMLDLLPFDQWMAITGNPPLAAWTAAKILWVRKHQPEIFAQCRHILLPKDYLRFVLTGDFATDVSDASGMQLLDVPNRCWSDVILDKLAIDKGLLGKVYESVEVTGTLTSEMASLLGLSPATLVVGGTSDNAGAAVGTGIVEEGAAFTSIGTSAIVYTHLNRYTEIPNGSLHICCSAVPGCYHTMGGPQSAGLSLEWFKNNFCDGLGQLDKDKNIYGLINDIVGQVAVGSDRLIYLPHLMGERTPNMNPNSRGAFIGLNPVHGKAHLLRAIMEGVSYSLADCNNILKANGIPVSAMRICGGGSKSPIWREILANLYQIPVTTLAQEEGAAYGVAILAAVASGLVPSIQWACTHFIQTAGETAFDRETSLKYEKLLNLYDKIYDDLVGDFKALASLEL